MTYYPIGTVVKLKGERHPVMIYGRKQFKDGLKTIWDYVACLYPEGNINDEYNVFFQQEEIEKVLFKGFESVWDLKMQEILNRNLA